PTVPALSLHGELPIWKDRKGIVPVANEPMGAPEKYGDDRFFIYFRFEGDENHVLDRQVAALQANGHPVVRLDLRDKHDLGQEFRSEEHTSDLQSPDHL